MNKAAALRNRLEHRPALAVVGAHDGLTAKLIERYGFDGIWASGFGISTSAGVPDASVLTMTEFLAVASEINEVIELPVIADCDCGFGDAVIVERLARKYSMHGIAGICLEDKCFPKINSFVPGPQKLASIEEFASKIAAAVAGRRDNGLVVIARTEALIVGSGQEEALRRAHAYAEAGADAILVHSKSDSPAEVLKFASRWDRSLPLVAIPTSYFRVTQSELEAAGFRMVIYANQAIRAAVRAMEKVLATLRKQGTTRQLESRISSLRDLLELQNIYDVARNRLEKT